MSVLNQSNVDIFSDPSQWHPYNQQRLLHLIKKKGIQSPTFSKEKPPYIVFDWDNTAIINDIQEAVLIYQLQHFELYCTPKQLEVILYYDVSPHDFAQLNWKENNKNINALALIKDILQSYQHIYQERASATSISTAYHTEFIVKMHYFYYKLAKYTAYGVHIRLAIRLLSGMTLSKVQTLTHQCLQAIPSLPQFTSLTSMATIKSQTGLITTHWHNQVKPRPLIQSLFQQLKSNGFHIYICSASFHEIVRTFACSQEYGYTIPKNNILAMELSQNTSGKLLPEIKPYLAETHGIGKVERIKQILIAKYHYEPVLVAGDSIGDKAMLTAFSHVDIALIQGKNKADPYLAELVEKALIDREKKISKAGCYLFQPF